jgi:hypothetical protein
MFAIGGGWRKTDAWQRWSSVEMVAAFWDEILGFGSFWGLSSRVWKRREQ